MRDSATSTFDSAIFRPVDLLSFLDERLLRPNFVRIIQLLCLSSDAGRVRTVCREFFLVMANVFFSTQPALCCGLNLFANTVFLVVHNVPADTRCLKWLKAQRSVNPPSSSKFINYLASLLLCCGAPPA